MARIDLVALQQRLAQQQPKPVPAEPPSWSIRPASTLRTTPAPKARPAAAAALAGTLRATTTMRAALPSEATNARAVRAEERARATAFRAQIDELNAELVVARAEAARALAQEQARADRLSDQIEAGHRDLDAVRAEADRTAERAERALTGERQRADALRDRLEQAQAELAVAQHDAQTAQQAVAALRQAEADRKARGLVARLSSPADTYRFVVGSGRRAAPVAASVKHVALWCAPIPRRASKARCRAGRARPMDGHTSRIRTMRPSCSRHGWVAA